MGFKLISLTLFVIFAIHQSRCDDIVNSKLTTLENLVQAMEDSRSTRNDVIKAVMNNRLEMQTFVDDSCLAYTADVGTKREESLDRVAKAKASAGSKDISSCLKDESQIVDLSDLAINSLSTICFGSSFGVADIVILTGINTAHYYTRFHGVADNVIACIDEPCIKTVQADIDLKKTQTKDVLLHQQQSYQDTQHRLFATFQINLKTVETDMSKVVFTADEIVTCIENL